MGVISWSFNSGTSGNARSVPFVSDQKKNPNGSFCHFRQRSKLSKLFSIQKSEFLLNKLLAGWEIIKLTF